MKFDADKERITIQLGAIDERAKTLGIEVEMLRQQVGDMDITPLADGDRREDCRSGWCTAEDRCREHARN